MRYSDFELASQRRLPVIRSSESSECALVCIAMIAAFHGRHQSLNELRARFSVSSSGLRLRDIMRIADALGLASRPIKVDLEALSDVSCPAILHWNFTHFVVLKSVSRDGLIIHDPSAGRKRIGFREASEAFTGVVLELSPTDAFEKLEPKRSLRFRRLVPRLEGGWASLAQVLFLSAAVQICAFAMPFQIQIIVDQAIVNQQAELLPVVLLAFSAIVLLQALGEGLRNWTIVALGNLFSLQVVTNLIRHLLRLPTSFFERRHAGDILSRIGSTSALQEFITQGIFAIILDGLMALFAGVLLFVYSPLMAGIVVAGLLLNFVIAQIIFYSSRLWTQEKLQAGAIEQSFLIETVGAATLIKVMGAEANRAAAWRTLFLRTLVASQAIGKLNSWQGALRTAINGLQLCLLVYFGAKAVMDGEGFSVGMLVAFLSFRATFVEKVMSLVDQVFRAKLLGVHLERISDIVDTEPEPQALGYRGEDVRGAIELRDVSFQYGLSDKPVLHELSLAIQPADFVAIIGMTGSGKTTLLKLLLGLHHPARGDILLDGKVADATYWREWRGHVGYVAQDDYPLSGTAAENIAFFDPDLDIDRVVEVAKLARIHDDIAGLPMQYATPIAHLGSNLSGGQRQRLMLARALYRDPKVLILDEGTANLDLETEEDIADLLCEMPVTRIVVAHRPSLVKRAKQVFELRDGALHASSAARMRG